VFLGLAGNGVTVWAYARNKSLQTSFNILIANLCLVDLIFSVVVISLILPGYVSGVSIVYHLKITTESHCIVCTMLSKETFLLKTIFLIKQILFLNNLNKSYRDR